MTDDPNSTLGVTPVPDLAATQVRASTLKTLARDIVEGRVFCTYAMPAEAMRLLPMIFLPLAFMAPAERQKLINQDIAFFYEYYDKAGPQAVNGYPIFTSVRYLAPDEEDVLVSYLREIHLAFNKILDTPTA